MVKTRPEIRFVAIGEIVAAQGIRGEVRVLPLTDHPERFDILKLALLGPADRDPETAPVPVEHTRLHGQFVLVKLAGVDDRDAAEKLRKQLIYVPRSEVAPLPAGSYYVFELIGLSVVTETGESLGELSEVITGAANDIYVVRLPDGQEMLLPATREVVRKVDLPEGLLVVRLLPGLREGGETP